MGVGATKPRYFRMQEADVVTIVRVLLHLLEVAGAELGGPQLAAAIAALEALVGAVHGLQDEE